MELDSFELHQWIVIEPKDRRFIVEPKIELRT